MSNSSSQADYADSTSILSLALRQDPHSVSMRQMHSEIKQMTVEECKQRMHDLEQEIRHTLRSRNPETAFSIVRDMCKSDSKPGTVNRINTHVSPTRSNLEATTTHIDSPPIWSPLDSLTNYINRAYGVPMSMIYREDNIGMRYPVRPRPHTYRRQSVYRDKQNVHTYSIDDSITRSVNNLKTDSKPDFSSTLDLILDSDLDPDTKQRLVQFCDNTTQHEGSALSYKQLLAYVWQRIQHPGSIDGQSEDDRRIELERILEQQIDDSIDKPGNEVCFTGRFSRLVSTLDGFFEDIRIGISDNEAITAIVLQTRDSLKPYDAQVHTRVATQALIEAGFEYEQFRVWINELEAV